VARTPRAVVEGVGVVLGALVLFLGLGEAATRVLNRAGLMYDVEMFKYSRALKRDAPPEAPDMHHWHVPNASAVLQGVTVTTNSKGLRDHEHAYEIAPGVTRVLVLGDSITLGWGIPMEDSYPKVLERQLNGGAPNGAYEVVNAGVGNYTTSRIIGLYRHELHKYAAPVVVFSFFINNANDQPDSRVRFLFETPLQFPVFLWSRAQRVTTRYNVGKGFDAYYADLYSDGNPMYQRFRDNLGSFLKELRAAGKRVVLVSLPDVLHLQEPSYRYQAINDKVFAIAREADVPTLDLFPSVKGMAPQEIMNTPEDRHPNSEGHRRMGQALYDFLKSLGV
jgi:lysophospholipase L1-like esterase